MKAPAATHEGRVAMVTGGARGIGLATARRLACDGASIAIVDLDAEAASDAARQLGAETDAVVRSYGADVSEESQVGAVFDAVERDLGPVALLVNNAGIVTPELLPVEQVPAVEFDRMLAVHARGSFLCSARAIPEMKTAGYGRIMMVSSLVGPLGFADRVAYATAKSGLVGMTRALAVEGGPYGISVNAVAPGWILTPVIQQRVAAGTLDEQQLLRRTAQGRWGRPEDVARVVAAMFSPAFDYVTGAEVPVDGGYRMRGDDAEVVA
ncbi:SDR family NAD(P)-dependent oxidoreductase [Aeromicrobium sp. CF4.19]|uniref:SDR family NAD(P)-dependent oxidoreductase n=1 Tax=Aeromicrobium sp. CF4.19 TaxID=3373082 RepID=UPI003EE7EA4E